MTRPGREDGTKDRQISEREHRSGGQAHRRIGGLSGCRRILGLGILLAALAVPASAVASPANDDFADASPVPSAAASSTLSADTTSATREAGEPGPSAAANPGPTLWYRWTAANSRPVTVSTCGLTSLDTVIYVFKGTTLASLSLVAFNDDVSGGGCGVQSRVSFTSQKGIAYSIQLSTYGTAPRGPFTATLDTNAPLNNDNFASAVTFAGPAATYTFDSTGATKETGEPNHAGDAGGKSVWYSWQAPSSGFASISTCGSSFDTLLAVYTGSAVNGLTPVASNDDGCNGQQSSVDFAITAGAVYRIAVDGFSAASGAGVLNFSAGVAGTPPALIIDGPEGTTSSPSPSFYFGADAFADFTCALDAGSPAPCTPPQQYPGLADGQHTFHLSGGGTSTTRTFTVDTAPPTVQIDSPADGATTGVTPTFSFTAGADATDVKCSIDTGSPAFGPCSGPGSSHTPAAPLANGTYTFRVKAADGFGNARTAARSFTVTTEEGGGGDGGGGGSGGEGDGGDVGNGGILQAADPETAITKAKINSATRKAKISFTGSGGTGPLSYLCQLDRKPFKPCASPAKLKHLRPGKHTFQVAATDAAGKTDPTPAKDRFRVAR